MAEPDKDHWLVRAATIRWMWILGGAMLVLLVLGDFFVEHHPHFGVDGLPGFSAVYGFVTCVLMVVGSRAVGLLLKRPDDYYDE